jgi:hypothetical protein
MCATESHVNLARAVLAYGKCTASIVGEFQLRFQLRDQLEGSWRAIAAYPVIASAGLAGVIRASWWWVVAIALFLSLMRWDSLSERAKEVSEERHRSGRRPRIVEASLAVLSASFLMHFFLCALAYFLGRGLTWSFWEVMR